MYKHVLIPTDGSELARAALMHGLFLARSINARVTVVTVEVPPHASHDRIGATVSSAAAEILQRAREDAQVVGVSCNTVHIQHNYEHEGIIRVAREKDCDIIVMASHGRSGVSALLLGSVARRILARSTLPVLIYRPIWAVDSRPRDD